MTDFNSYGSPRNDRARDFHGWDIIVPMWDLDSAVSAALRIERETGYQIRIAEAQDIYDYRFAPGWDHKRYTGEYKIER